MTLDRTKKLVGQSSTRKTLLLALLGFLISFGFSDGNRSSAQMSGTNYKIPVDSINIGGQQGASASYNLLDSAGEIATGASASSSYGLNAGFIGAQSVYLAISSGSDVTMSPAIAGISGGTGTGSTVWAVATDNAAGYTLTIRTSTNPALRSITSSFADYTTAGANPDYTWSVAAADSEYGFTPEGTDIISRYKDNGSACNTGSGDTADRCWDKLTTSDQQIAQRGSGNHPSGTTTTVKMQAEVGGSHIQPNGTYDATVTVTALPL